MPYDWRGYSLKINCTKSISFALRTNSNIKFRHGFTAYTQTQYNSHEEDTNWFTCALSSSVILVYPHVNGCAFEFRYIHVTEGFVSNS